MEILFLQLEDLQWDFKEDFMNFISIKAIISLITFLGVILLYFKLNKTFLKKDNLKRLYIFCSLIVLIIITLVLAYPVENLWKSFNSVEEAFKYKFPEYKIIEKLESDDIAVVLYSNSENLIFEYFTKKNNNWKLVYSLFNHDKLKVDFLDVSCSYSYAEIYDKILINIACPRDENNIILKSDGSELKKLNLNMSQYYAVMDKNDYITYNDKKIEFNND